MQKFNNIEEIKGYINTLDIAPNEQDLLDIIYTVFVVLKTPFSSKKKYECFYGKQANGIGCAIGAILPDKFIIREDELDIESITIDVLMNDAKFKDIHDYLICHSSNKLMRLQQLHDIAADNSNVSFEKQFLIACKDFFNIDISEELLTETSKEILKEFN